VLGARSVAHSAEFTGDRARPVTTGVEPTELKLRDLLLSQSVPRVQPLQGRGYGFESRRLHSTFPAGQSGVSRPLSATIFRPTLVPFACH
jgi:hypothetical protein